MTYPQVTQFETKAIEAEARAQLTRERRFASAAEQETQSRRHYRRRVRIMQRGIADA